MQAVTSVAVVLRDGHLDVVQRALELVPDVVHAARGWGVGRAALITDEG